MSGGDTTPEVGHPVSQNGETADGLWTVYEYLTKKLYTSVERSERDVDLIWGHCDA
jgi:hypothetical protein